MALGLSLSLETADFDAIEKVLLKFESKAITTLARNSMNKGLDSISRRAGQIAQKERFLKISEIRAKYFELTRAKKGGRLNKIYAEFFVRNKSIPMLKFVKGPKTPRSQEGIPVRKRKALRFEVTKGKRFKGKGAIFLATVRGKTDVYRRGVGRRKREVLYRQTLSGYARYFRKPEVANELSILGRMTYLREVEKGLKKRGII